MSERPAHHAILLAVNKALCKNAEDIDSFDGKTHYITGNTGDFVPAAVVATLRTLLEVVRLPNAVEEFLVEMADLIEDEQELPREGTDE